MSLIHRFSATRLAPALFTSLLIACNADATGPDVSELDAVLESPGPTVAAAVIEFTGVTGVTVAGGQSFSHRDGGLVRAVFILDDPGQLEFRVTLAADGPDPSARVIEVADGNDQLVASVAEYRVSFNP